MSLSASQMEKAKQAIDILSSLNLTAEHHSTTTHVHPDEVLAAADRCLSVLNKYKPTKSTCTKTKRKAKEELSSLFNKKSRVANQSKVGESSKCLWKHKFVCLAYHDQSRIPTNDVDKDDLLRAGLGEKEIEFNNMELNADGFRELLYQFYPSLKNGGGFQFFKCAPNTRNLQLLSSTTLSSPAMLKTRVGNARTYIRPLQKDLDMSAVLDLPGGPKEKCLNCGEDFTLENLASHVSSCLSKHNQDAIDLTESQEFIDSDSNDLDLPPIDFGQSDDLVDFGQSEEFLQIKSIEDEMLDVAVEKSIHETTNSLDETDAKHENPSNLIDAITTMKKQINDDYLRIEIRRQYVLADALREARKKKFNPCKNIKILFVGEGAIDLGGPRREFFRLFALEASKYYFIGIDDKPKFILNNILAVQARDLYHLGVYFVLSVIHGGNGLPFMAEAVFQYLLSGSFHSSYVQTEDIPHAILKFTIEKLNQAENDDDLRVCLSIDECLELLLATGFCKPVCNLALDDRPNIIAALLHYHLIARVKAELDQFIEGLSTHDFLNIVRKDPNMWKPFFVHSNSKLTTDVIKDLFTVIKYSSRGSNHRPDEERTYIFFVDFLDRCDDEEFQCCLADILIFFSGSDRVPPLGFQSIPKLSFLHQDAKFPTASTCDIELRLPTKYRDYSEFEEAMILGIKSNDGFGGV